MNPSPLSNLADRAIRGVFWSAIERLGPQVVQFVISIVLARLLLPEQFGLIGMLSIFLGLGKLFLDSGFGQALIQKRDATDLHYSSVFYANICLSLVASGILCLAAPLIAGFFGKPLLTPLTRALSLGLVLNAFGLIQGVLLTKRLNFRTQMKISLMASIGSGVVGITMAVLGFGVWSLIAQNLSSALFGTLLLWAFNTWRPRAIFSLAALRGLFGFGSRLLASSILDTVFQNLYNVVIGKLFTPADLGHYTRAYTLQQLPAQTLSGSVGRVTLPLFAEIQNDPVRVRNGFQKAFRALALVNFPLMIGLLVCARPLVLTLLTDKWAPAIPYLQFLCVVGLLYPLHAINLNVLLALGRSDLFLRLEITKKILTVIVLTFTWRWGIEAMIIGQIVLSLVAYYLNSYYNRRLLGYGLGQQMRDALPYLVAAGTMGAGTYALSLLPLTQPGLLLLIQVVAGILVYGLLCRGFRLPIFMDAWRILQGKVGAPRTARL